MHTYYVSIYYIGTLLTPVLAPQKGSLGDGRWAPLTEQEYENPDPNISTQGPYYSNKPGVGEAYNTRAITKGAMVSRSNQNRAFYGNAVDDVYDDTANPDPYRSGGYWFMLETCSSAHGG